MPLMSRRYPNSVMHTEELRESLGLPKKLPEAGRMFNIWSRQGYFIRLLPLVGPAPLDAWGNPIRRMKHRIQVQCNHCGCWIPAGRLAQHEPACGQRDNSIWPHPSEFRSQEEFAAAFPDGVARF